jgi:hypothetical protein
VLVANLGRAHRSEMDVRSGDGLYSSVDGEWVMVGDGLVVDPETVDARRAQGRQVGARASARGILLVLGEQRGGRRCPVGARQGSAGPGSQCRRAFPGGPRVGTVDRFQGQEAPVVIYAMGVSSSDLAPRGLGFLFSTERFKVATSRAQALVVLVAGEALFDTLCRTPEEIRLVNERTRALPGAGGLTRSAC